jgi:3-oxoacyl-[acyl-carrier-protein] synthase III
MSIGIHSIAMYLPSIYVNNIDESINYDSDKDFIKSKIGFVQLSRKEQKEEASDLALQAVLKLKAKSGLDLSNIECLIVVTQNPDGSGLPHTSAILHQKLKLSSKCAVFDISLGCSGYVQALSLAKSFMNSQNMTAGLLITSDPYSKIIDPKDRDTAMLFGDGSTATLLSTNPSWNIGAFDFGIDSSLSNALRIDNKNHLYMNGRSVFTFAATQIPKSVNRLLSSQGLSMADIDQLFLHQGSKYIVETLAKRLDATDKTPFLAKYYGNLISSSIPAMLCDHLNSKWSRILLSGFGVGLSWASCLLEKNHDYS